jgi:hypothetical protein
LLTAEVGLSGAMATAAAAVKIAATKGSSSKGGSSSSKRYVGHSAVILWATTHNSGTSVLSSSDTMAINLNCFAGNNDNMKIDP